MAIDQFSDARALNIKELSITPPKETDRKFDPRRDVHKEDWKGLKKILLGYGKSYDPAALNFYDFLTIASTIKLLAPEYLPENVTSDMYAKDEIHEINDDWKSLDLTPIFSLRTLTDSALLHPDIYDQFMSESRKVVLKDVVWGRIDKAIEVGRPEYNLEALFGISRLKILEPGLLEHSQSIDKITDTAKAICERLLQRFGSLNVSSFLDHAAELKIIAPDKFKELHITGEHWKTLRDYVNEGKPRDDAGEIYADLMRRLSIIAADKVRIKDRRIYLEFNDTKPELEHINPIPERRKF
jgi:hypothetical protein